MKSAARKFFILLPLFPIATPVMAQEATTQTAPEVHPKYIRVVVKSSIAAAFNGVLGSGNGDALAAHVGRLAIWWFNLTKDVQKGDVIEILYKSAPMPARYEIHALRYQSQSTGNHSAFLYNGRYYDENGYEVEQRLRHAPIMTYDQVTERMNLAGRNHRGIDFKAPEGTPLFAPYDGVVERIWNAKHNGNSLKIKLDHKEQRALYLHLLKVEPGLAVGTRVHAGQKVAEVGNTGRSTSAHLHYEIHDKNDNIMDPFLADETFNQQLPEKLQASFRQWLDYYTALLNHGK